jgi:hypothetical protein
MCAGAAQSSSGVFMSHVNILNIPKWVVPFMDDSGFLG